jgi:acetyl esterase
MSHHRNPRALLTPVMRGVLERMERAGRAPLHALTPDQARAAYEAGAGVLELPPHKLARVEDLQFPPATATRCRRACTRRSRSPRGPARLAGAAVPARWRLHRGQHRHPRCAVPPPERTWRIAPWCRWSTGWRRSIVSDRSLYDAWDSLNALRAQAAALGLDGTRLAVGGDSAAARWRR